ncbi:MAG: transposase [Verrucomicrobia bacterium]|nr:transposase [Verrucomicrobiota bacterium]
MNTKPALQVVAEKRQWHHQPTAEEKARGFMGWYSRGYLPHFDAPGTWQFITYRLADSIPAERRHEWAEAMRLEDDREKFRRMELVLDRGFGTCSLREPRMAQMVQENLWFHDVKAYRLMAWVIMPNHLHILAEMWKPLGVVLKNWKSYTGTEANKILGHVGDTFWQADYFDRYIRDQKLYRKVVRYIENNPGKAGLVREPAQCPWSSAPYRGPYGSDELPKIPKHRAEESGQPCPPETNAKKPYE